MTAILRTIALSIGENVGDVERDIARQFRRSNPHSVRVLHQAMNNPGQVSLGRFRKAPNFDDAFRHSLGLLHGIPVLHFDSPPL